MAEPLTLFGYRYSVYTRIVRMALIHMELQARYVETDPFRHPKDEVLANLNRFHRVPVLRHGDFVLTETAAILRYLETLSTVRGLLPDTPKASARMQQVIGIIDNYGYVPLVRQFFAHSVFRPFMNERGDNEIIAKGIAGSHAVLATLETIVEEGLILDGETTLADLHLAPMIAYFDLSEEGHRALKDYPRLSSWWDVAATLPPLLETDPFSTNALA